MASARSVARPGRLTNPERAAASLEAGRPFAGGRLPIEVRTLRVGMRVTLLAPLAAAAMFVLASRTRVALGGYGLLLTGLAVAAALATLLPWDRLMERRVGMVLLSVWAMTALGMVTVGIWATGGARSPLVLLYALTTVFFAVAFPPRGQVALLAMTLVAYGLTLQAADQGPLPLVVLSVLTFLAGSLVQQIRVQVHAAWEAREEADHRWALLATVSAAARDMSSATADTDAVLGTTIEAVEGLGFPSPRIFVREPDGWHIVPGTPVPNAEVPAAVIRTAETGEAGLFERTSDRLPLFGAAVPIPVSNRVAAVLVAGSESAPGPTAQDVEVFRMLASQASLALENVRRFEEQRQAIERLAELDRMKNDFLSTVSHELRTPLTVITGMGRTLEHQWRTIDEEIRSDFLARLNANAATLNQVIAQLLDFSKLEAGQLRPDTRDVDLTVLLPDVVHRLGTLLRDHHVEVDVEPDLRTVADPGLVERIVENLLSNAAKYTPPGSRVVVSARGTGNEAIVAVTDDGPGIPQNEVARIGERFFRGGDLHTRTTRGTGLGLAVVSEILELHGSRLEVESRVGEGSRFSFVLAKRPPAGMGADPHDGLADRGSQSRGLDRVTRSAVAATGGPGLRSERFETVMTAAALGVEWAIGLLYREFHPMLLRYLRARRIRRPEAAAEAIWEQIAHGLTRFSGDEVAFRRWLFGSARRHIEDAEHLDQQAGRGTDEESHAPMSDALAKVAGLPSDHADVLLLKALGRLTVDDVAVVTGQEAGAVRLLEIDAMRLLGDDEAMARIGESR
jgi:signal transduction histidine kinase/DNA-directed RNA polymerase specialized sigma24 family protein